MPNICLTFSTSHPAEKIHQALTRLEGLKAWWTHDVHGHSGEGQILTFTFSNNGSFDMQVIRNNGNQVCWKCIRGPEDWLGTHIEFNIQETPAHNQLMFRHTGWAEENPFFHHCSTKWATFLLSLRDYVETGQGRPFPNDVKIEAIGM
ncbi:SRPBCC family protein [Bowmanella yangjiangensis]|uniref:SRPBCC domain-containing protein n=1 Tax=Bowmanella yangjiangensis TaxID=2811230 RepID=A0ABS3CXJ3_9ALTE|nr:SRPBCC domain-containing protein [Bowmanella yangjiangensis]MBN7821035.1 SRPBCC domain-containing protein [Bowmanella yangjiangensis]